MHDGHGSVRVLVDALAAVVRVDGLEQIFFFDAYGNALNEATKNAATTLLYSGEQFDSRIQQQYLRARYYNAQTGHFNRLDPFFGNVEDPQSFHKYAYAHSDPVTFYDPTGKFIGILGLLTSITGGLNARTSKDSSDLAAFAQTGNTYRTIQMYHKVLEVLNKIKDIAEIAEETIDLMAFDPSDIEDIWGQTERFRSMATSAAAGGLVNLPPEVKKFDLPKGIIKKINEFKMKLPILGSNLVQEFVGELGSALVMRSVGFIPGELDIDASHGPDAYAQHAALGIWGVFEAKGGTSKLGRRVTATGGTQMSYAWIRWWTEDVARRNAGTPDGDSLGQAWKRRNVMVAAVTSLNLNRTKDHIKTGYQAFKPGSSSSLQDFVGF